MHRREALKLGAAAAAVHIVPRHVLGGPSHVPPSQKINVALIGAGGRGRQVVQGMMDEEDVRVVAVADPAESFSLENFYYRGVGGREPMRKTIEERYRNEEGFSCAGYVDFRDMLEEQPDIDAVVCATPDHLHAYVTSVCLAAGKHVYCEKPLTHNIWEARAIAQLAKASGLATQMGNQGHSTDGIRETCELIWSGAIGEVHDVKVWVSGHRWNPALSGLPATGAKVPPGLDWDLWLGPREPYDFEPAYFPVAWRDFWAFGNSNIGDFACHDIDAACWALDLREPTTIDFAPAGVCNAQIGPHGCIGYYRFPANDQRGPVDLTWYDGGLRPPRPADWPAGKPFLGRGVLFTGEEGQILCGGAGGAPQLLPEDRFKNFVKPEPSLTRVKNHNRNWLDAIQGGEKPASNFEYGAKLTEIALLGALSLRTGQPITWDAKRMQAPGVKEAESIIKEGYRPGWKLAMDA